MATKFITVSIEIMHDDKLSPNQKFILAEIEQLNSLDKGCFASNRHFSELIGITPQGVSKAIHDLESKGYIKIDNAQTKRNFGRIITINSGKSAINSGKSAINSGLESKGNKTTNKTVRGIPTKEQVIKAGKRLNYDSTACIKFYNYYSSLDWKRGRSDIVDFVPLLRNWNMNEKEEAEEEVVLWA